MRHSSSSLRGCAPPETPLLRRPVLMRCNTVRSARVAVGAISRVGRRGDRTSRACLLRRPLRRGPRPVGLRDEPVRGGEVRRPRSRRSRAGASPRALEIGCSIGVLTTACRATCDDAARDRRRRDRARRAPAPAYPTSPSSAARSPRSSRTARYDLTVVSEVLYYLDAPAFDATLDAIERTLTAPCWPSTGARSAERYPFTGDEVHERLTRSASAPPAYSAPDRQVQPRPLRRMRLVIVGGGPAALATARAYREAGGDGDVTLSRPSSTVPYQRPPLSKEFLRGEMDDDELPIEPPRPGTTSHGVDGPPRRARPRRSTRDARTSCSAAASRCTTTPACSPPAPSRRRCPCPARPRNGCCCCAASPTARVLRDRAATAEHARS